MLNRLKRLFSKSEENAPPTCLEAAQRAAVLKMLATYGMLASVGGVAIKVGREEIVSSARSGGLWKFFSKSERAIVEGVQSEPEASINASWRLEALGTLLWALKLVPWMPAYDLQSSGDNMAKLPSDNFMEFAGSLTLRKRDDLEKARELAELWHWRSRTRQLIEEGRPFPAMPQFKSYDEIVRFTAKAAKEKDTLQEIIDEDFAAKGKAYRDLTEAEWTEVRSITVERHFALNWLCGYAPGNRWDETPTGT